MSQEGFSVRHNLPDFTKTLSEIRYKMGRKAVRYATSGAGQVLRDRSRGLAPIGTLASNRGYGHHVPGLLKRSIILWRSKRISSRTTEGYSVGVKGGKAKTKKGLSRDAYYWRWVEQGHLARGPGGKITGGNKTRALKRKRLLSSGASFTPGVWYLRDGLRVGSRAAVEEFSRRLDSSFKALVREVDRTKQGLK